MEKVIGLHFVCACPAGAPKTQNQSCIFNDFCFFCPSLFLILHNVLTYRVDCFACVDCFFCVVLL